MRKITIYTFQLFWSKFHVLNTKQKLRKSDCEKIWNDCNFSSKKKSAIKALTKGLTMGAYEYIKHQLT